MIATLSFSSLLGLAALAAAGPVVAPRAVDSLNEAATAEAHQRDNTATRAFSNVQIKTSDGRCLFVDKLSGDFRANLTPVQIGACGATDGQGWDIITAGKHINVANSMIIVSTLTNACFNFDPRRAAGNQVLLFSCGGRADGGGDVTSSQLFAFGGGAGPLSLAPANQKGSCLTVKGNVLDIASCNGGDAGQSFTLGGTAVAGGGGGNKNGGGATGGKGSPSPPQQAKPTATGGDAGAKESPSKCSGGGVRTVTVTASLDGRGYRPTQPPRGTASAKPTGVALGAAVPDTLEPTTSKSQTEEPTKAPVKSKTRGRNKPGAAGTTAPTSAEAAATTPGVALGAAVPDSSEAAATSAGPSASEGAKTRTRTRGGGRGKGKGKGEAATKTSQTGVEAAATESSETGTTSAAVSTEATTASGTGSAPIVAPTGKVKAIANPTTPVPVSRAGGTLQPSAAAQANQRDGTATRAFSNVEIRAPNGQCLFIDPTAGDFRQNLIPVQLVDCSGTPNEKFDVITAGKHNNAPESALIVSSLMNGCVSFDGRRAQGDTVTMFSCGGRGDGEGETNSGQLVRFIGALSFAMAPKSENGKTCVLPGNGRLESGPCPTDGAQLFSIFP